MQQVSYVPNWNFCELSKEDPLSYIQDIQIVAKEELQEIY